MRTAKRNPAPAAMEVCVIKPNNMEETREIADTLIAGCTVVLNLEGIDVSVAQRVIDFSSGTCYAMGGSSSESLRLHIYSDSIKCRNYR